MNQILRHFATDQIEIDENTGFASSLYGQPCNAWTVKVRGAWFDVWTAVDGSVLLALPV